MVYPFLYQIPVVMVYPFLYQIPVVMVYPFLYQIPVVMVYPFLYQIPVVLGYPHRISNPCRFGLFSIPSQLSTGLIFTHAPFKKIDFMIELVFAYPRHGMFPNAK